MDVTSAVDEVCAESGLDSTVASTDRIRALAYVNRAYKRILIQTRCAKDFGYYALAGNPDIPLSSFTCADTVPNPSTTFTAVDTVWYMDPTLDTFHPGSTFLDHVTFSRIVSSRQASDTQPPSAYDVQNSVLRLDSAPNGDGSRIVIFGDVRVGNFAEGDPESYIYGIDPLFHDDLLVTLALCYALEGYEGQEERAGYYRQQHVATMQQFREYLLRQGGLRLPGDGQATSAWSTPTPRTQR